MDPWKQLMRKAEAIHAVVNRTELVAAGLSPGQVDRWREAGRLVDLAPGVYRMGGSPATFEARVMAAVLSYDGATWASHHTASRLLDLGVAGRDDLVHLTRPTVLSAQRTGVHVHRSTCLPDHHLTTVAGIPTTTAARTVFDLARTVGPHRLDRAIERATQRRLCTVATVYRVLYDLGGRGRPGTRRLREVLERWDADEPATESELDAVGRALLARVPGIEWQVPLSDERGYIRRVDGLLRSAALVIEFDGTDFHSTPSARDLDAYNDRRLMRQGYRVRRFDWTDLTRRADLTLAEIEHLVAPGSSRAS